MKKLTEKEVAGKLLLQGWQKLMNLAKRHKMLKLECKRLRKRESKYADLAESVERNLLFMSGICAGKKMLWKPDTEVFRAFDDFDQRLKELITRIKNV